MGSAIHVKAAARYAGPLFKLKTWYMMLKELETGKRFEFQDKRTALVLVDGQRAVVTGTFVYLGVGESGAAKLQDNRAGVVVNAIAATHLRHVIPIF